MLKYNLFLLLILSLVTNATAQTDNYLKEELPPQQENKIEWQQIVNGISVKKYVEELEKEEAEQQKEKKKKQKSEFKLGEPDPVVVAIMKYLLIATGIGIIAFLLYKLVGQINTPRNRKIKKGRLSEISLAEIEENIVEADLVDFIQQAIDEENYNLAIRLHYLLIIKELDVTGLIQWKKDKTNQSYLQELSDPSFHKEFKAVTQIFERVWYGRNELSKIDFSQIEPAFKQLAQSVSSSKTDA